ncbi:MAG: amidohydrolase family protein, partial [Actinomycetia bacterium]|nr:amidohydrolase family protein [Actinomycetes bacterium]
MDNVGCMTTTQTYRDATFISTDAHVTEPVDLYVDRVDAEFKHRAPHIVDSDGWRTLYVEGLGPRKLMTSSELEVATVGGYEASERIADQERDGVTAEVIFPTFALQACFAAEDAKLQLQLCQAYNSWATDTFAGQHRLL